MFEAQVIGELWTLRRDGDVRRAALYSHPIGTELRVSHGDSLLYSHAARDPRELIALAKERRDVMEAKGWK